MFIVNAAYTLSMIPLIIGVFFLITLLLQYLWNTTMPDLFNLKQVSFWQAFRLLLIAGILLGGPNLNF